MSVIGTVSVETTSVTSTPLEPESGIQESGSTGGVVVVAVVVAVVVGAVTWLLRNHLNGAVKRTIKVTAILGVAAAAAVKAGGASTGAAVIVLVAAAAMTAADQIVDKVIEPRRAEHAETAALESAELDDLVRIGTAECPLVDRIDPSVLGVRPSGLTSHTDRRKLPEYVVRDIDERIDSAIAEAVQDTTRLVVVAGHPKTGKTRSLYEAVRRLAPSRRVFVLAPPAEDGARPAERLAELASRLGDPTDLVVWIDDAHEHFERGLTTAVLDRLTELTGAILVMTVHLDALRPKKSRIGSDVVDQLRQASFGTTMLRALSPRELTEAKRTHPDLAGREDLQFLAEVLAAVPELRSRLQASNEPVGAAIVEAAIAWRRGGMTGPITKGRLRKLTEITLSAHTTVPLSDSTFESGLEWATEPVSVASALLVAVGRETWLPFDAIAAESNQPLSDSMWSLLFDLATTTDLLSLGMAAYNAEQVPTAQQAWASAAALGHPAAMSNLGVVLHEQDHSDEAEEWYREAAAIGHLGAMSNLGVLMKEQGKVEEALHWQRKAAQLAHPAAMMNLALLLIEEGDDDEAEKWYRLAADLDDPGAMVRLAVLLRDRGEDEEAEVWVRQAASLGNPDAMATLGALMREVGDDEEAEVWCRKGVNLDHPGAMSNLGLLLQDRGDTEEAEIWYRRAVDLEHSHAMYNLGILLKQRGDDMEAEHWYRAAADLDDPDAMVNLGLMLRERNHIEETERLWRRAAELGDSDGMMNLGVLLYHRGEGREAEQQLRAAAELLHPIAMYNLGALLHETGRVDEARRWWHQAADLGETNSIHSLGLQLGDGTEHQDG